MRICLSIHFQKQRTSHTWNFASVRRYEFNWFMNICCSLFGKKKLIKKLGQTGKRFISSQKINESNALKEVALLR
ncbi:unnamed protein product [Blepharisma stoltei]|uniref:Ribosomal protein L32 n=1 Tax=Blepharisma stoltei TaxID=1481888 RepID=A0AAU9JGF0_9CILI|nr:unnamed protein product [Blepharisma stoltei]